MMTTITLSEENTYWILNSIDDQLYDMRKDFVDAIENKCSEETKSFYVHEIERLTKLQSDIMENFK
jgi:hypothetical protein